MTSIENLKNAESALISTLEHVEGELNQLGTTSLDIALSQVRNAADDAKKRMTAATSELRNVLEDVLCHINHLVQGIVHTIESTAPAEPFIPQEPAPEPAPSEPTVSGVPGGTPDTSTNSISCIIREIDEMISSDPEVVVVNSDDLPDEHRNGIESWGERVQSAANSPVDPTPEPHRKRKRK